MKKCREANLNCSDLIPSSEFLLEVKNLIEIGKITKLRDLVDLVEEKYSELLNCELALSVFTELYEHKASCDLVKKIIITQLAGWIAEMLESLGYVKIKQPWR